MPGSHSPRSPSSAHRWRACPASVREEEGLPDEAGEEAIQGTVFHDYAADCLETGIPPQYLVGDRMLCEDGAYRNFTQEMANKMLAGLDLVWSIADAPGAQLFVEIRLDLSRWLGTDEFGTSDVCIVDVANRRIYVFDWKWGAGVPVQPEWNDQAILYALGCWASIAEEQFEGIPPSDIEVKIIIEQPRAPGGGGVWTTSMAALLAEGKRIKVDADRTRDSDPDYNPSEDACKFCRAARFNTCEARAAHILSMLDVDPALLDEHDDLALHIPLPERRALTPEARSAILLNRKLIENWLQMLHDEAMDDATRGLPVPQLKRVRGRSPARKWLDDDKAELMLVRDFGDEAWNKKLRSPAMIEDEVGAKRYGIRYERHALRGEAKPILVPDTDAREALPSYEDLLDEAWESDEPDETHNLI